MPGENEHELIIGLGEGIEELLNELPADTADLGVSGFLADNDITIVVVEIRGDKVRLGVEAPKEVPVHRREVFEAIARGEPVAEPRRAAGFDASGLSDGSAGGPRPRRAPTSRTPTR